MTNWLAQKAYGQTVPQPSEFKWYRDRYGLEFHLHPHYAMDYQIIAYGCYDEPMTRFINRHVKPGMVCLDVGANIGAVGLQLARKAGPTGSVHSFEPVSHVFDRLQRHVERNRMQGTIHLHRKALSDRSGQSVMAVANPSHPNQGMGSLVSREDHLSDEIRIETLTLDEFAERERLERLDVIKVDIQGAEPLFLAGARQTLRAMKPDMLMEVSPHDLAASGMTGPDLLAELEGLGYQIFEVTPKGNVGRRLDSREVGLDLVADSVFCHHQHRP